MPGLNSIYNDYGKNKNTLLIFETNFADSKASFQSWCNDKGVQYGAIAKTEGGSDFNIKLDNGNYGNPKYLIHPDSTFEKISNVQSALDAANVSKDPINDDTIDPTISLTSQLDGKTFDAESTINLTWAASDNESVASIKVEYNDGSWKEIASLAGDKTSYDWTAPAKEILGCKVRVTATDGANNSASDESGTFDITVKLDTINPSPDVLSFAALYPIVDEYGSTIDTTDGFATDKGVKATLSVTASDSAKNEWAWGAIYAELPDKSTLESVSYIKVTYTSNENFNLVLQQPPLNNSGESFRATLAKTRAAKTIVLKVDNKTFKKPDWSKNTDTLDLTKISSMAFEADARYAGGNYTMEIEEIILYNYNGSTPIVAKNLLTTKKMEAVSLVGKTVQFTMSNAQNGGFELFSASGRVVYSLPNQEFKAGLNTIALPSNLAKGVYFTVLSVGNIQQTRKVVLSK